MQTKINQTYAGSQELLLADQYLIGYHQYLVRKMVGTQKKTHNVLDFGAGVGSLSQEWFRVTRVMPDSVEIDPHLRAVLTQKGLPNYPSLSALSQTYDLIFSSNVLEHIHDDRQTLGDLKKYLKKDGKLILFVPAFQNLYSGFDLRVGHYRRYEKKDLCEKLIDAGFTVSHYEYVDSVGYLAWAWLKLFGSQSSAISGMQMKIYDRYIFPFSCFLDRIFFKKRIGKNIFMVAELAN